MSPKSLRTFTTQALFDESAHLGLIFDNHAFESLSKIFDTPEEMTQALSHHLRIPEKKEHFYGVIFELWRRFCPEKQSLSIFCDHLDKEIQKYYSCIQKNCDDALLTLQKILDDNVDAGITPKTVFKTIQENCDEDIETFLFQYIGDQIEEKNLRLATELVEGFYNYVNEPIWFDYLKARLEFNEDSKKFEELWTVAEKSKNIDLLLEMLSFLTRHGPHALFQKVAHSVHPLLEIEADFVEFVTYVSLHYRFLKLEQLADEVEAILANRYYRPLNTPLIQDDQDLVKTTKFLTA